VVGDILSLFRSSAYTQKHRRRDVEEQKIKSPGSPKTLKTYNSRDSLMVTHLTTNPPVSCLNRAERTGSLVFMILWSYVAKETEYAIYIIHRIESTNAMSGD
jgi:hypothetical protein